MHGPLLAKWFSATPVRWGPRKKDLRALILVIAPQGLHATTQETSHRCGQRISLLKGRLAAFRKQAQRPVTDQLVHLCIDDASPVLVGSNFIPKLALGQMRRDPVQIQMLRGGRPKDT